MAKNKETVLETLRKRYLGEYRRIYKTADRIVFFEELRILAAKAGLSPWEKFIEGTLFFLRKDNEKAFAAFEEAISLEPNFAFPWHGKGNVFDDLKRYEEALSSYGQAIQRDPEFAYPWNGKGNVFAELKRYEEALAAYEQAIQLDPELAFPWNGKGNVLLRMKRYEESLAAYEQAIQRDPEDFGPWNGKGSVFYEMKRYEEALAAYKQAVALDPEWAGVHYNLGILYWERQLPELALEEFRQAIALGLDIEWEEAAKSWIERITQMIAAKEAGRTGAEREEEDKSSDNALITELFEAIKEDLPEIENKKIEFKKSMESSVAKPRVIGKDRADNLLFVLRDWNSFSPILRRELRGQDGPGPEERLGGGYFLAWKGHGVAIDPGVDFVTQLYRKGLSIADIDTVVVTHCHLDHTRDLESLVDLNYRYNEARGNKPHPPNPKFRQIQFKLSPSASMKYNQYLKASGCCGKPTHLDPDGNPWPITPFIDVQIVSVEHMDINGQNNEAIGLVFILKDDDGTPEVRVGITSDSRWIESLPVGFMNCDVLIAHLGTIEVGEAKGPGKEEAGAGGFLRTDLRNHLGTKGCFRLLQRARPTIFVVGEFGEELVQTRFKILKVFNKLKLKPTRCVLGGDSNLVIGLGKELSVLCSHPECARSWNPIAIEDIHPVLGGDFLFQYICPRHGLINEG